MTVSEIPKKGEKTCRDHIQRLGMAPLVEGWDHPPISKILTQNCSCLKEMQGQRVEQTEEKAIQRWPPPRDISHLQTPNISTIADDKKHLLTGA